MTIQSRLALNETGAFDYGLLARVEDVLTEFGFTLEARSKSDSIVATGYELQDRRVFVYHHEDDIKIKENRKNLSAQIFIDFVNFHNQGLEDELLSLDLVSE